ncbi:23598_t:CDS:2, partial [Gigaspora rosea]
MAYQISAGQPIAISSDEESNYLFETGQHVNDNEQSFDDEQGFSDEQAIKLNSEEFTEEIDKAEQSLEIVTKIKYRLEFEEYPETSENGVACVYNVAVYKETRTCGIKICQFGAPELVTMTHTSYFNTNVSQFLISLFAAAHKVPCGFVCSQTEDDTSASTYFIGCKNFKNGERGHRYQSISGRVNIEYLKNFFMNIHIIMIVLLA